MNLAYISCSAVIKYVVDQTANSSPIFESCHQNNWPPTSIELTATLFMSEEIHHRSENWSFIFQ